MKSEIEANMIQLQAIFDRRLNVPLLEAMAECPQFTEKLKLARNDAEADTRELLLITNQCRSMATSDMMRECIEEIRREAVIILCDRAESDYNYGFIAHYERMLLAVECTLELAESSLEYVRVG